MVPAEQTWITDTTFRDGQQARPPYTVSQIVTLYKFLNRLGGPNGVIRQSEFFLYSDKDKEAVQACLELGYDYPEITGWIRAKKEDFQLVKEMGLKETGILTSASDYHIFLKLGKTRKEAMDMYLDVVSAALEVGVIPRCHFEDITRGDFYGFVIPFAQELMRLSEQADMPVKIRACDTLGFGITYPGASLPRSVPGIMYGLTHYAGVPSEWLEWHGHNDFYRAIDNATGAWLYGCSAANGTLLGLGERTGNTPIEGLVMEYLAFRGITNGIDTTVITEIADYYRSQIGHDIPSNQPFVGSHFNVTRAGIHADGLRKNEEVYNIFDTDLLLNRPVGIAITDKSGLSGIAYWMDVNLTSKTGRKVDKRDPRLKAIKDWVDEQFANQRTAAISDEEMLTQVKTHFPELFRDEALQCIRLAS